MKSNKKKLNALLALVDIIMMAMDQPIKERAKSLPMGNVVVIMHCVRRHFLNTRPTNMINTVVVVVVVVFGGVVDDGGARGRRTVIIIEIRSRDSLDPNNLFTRLDLWERARVGFWDRGCDLVGGRHFCSRWPWLRDDRCCRS